MSFLHAHAAVSACQTAVGFFGGGVKRPELRCVRPLRKREDQDAVFGDQFMTLQVRPDGNVIVGLRSRSGARVM